MNGSISYIFKDKSIRYSLVLAGASCALQLLSIGFLYFKLPPVIPFFNSLPWGEARLVPIHVFFMMPFTILAFAVINVFFAATTHSKYALVSRMLSLNILLASILSTIALIQIFLLIF